MICSSNSRIHIDHLLVTCPADQCSTQNGNIPWHVVDDRTIVCNVPSSGEKIVTTLASLVCDVTKTRGITEIRVIDHALSPKLKAWCVQKPPQCLFLFLGNHFESWNQFASQWARPSQMGASSHWLTDTVSNQITRWIALSPRTSRTTSFPFEGANSGLFGMAKCSSYPKLHFAMWFGRPGVWKLHCFMYDYPKRELILICFDYFALGLFVNSHQSPPIAKHQLPRWRLEKVCRAQSRLSSQSSFC